MRAMLKMAGGIPNGGKWQTEYSLDEFIVQAEEYRTGGDVADQVYKVLNLMATTHPFYVLRVSEIRDWIEGGDYDRIIRGEYPRRGDPDPAIQEDLKAAAKAYAEGAKGHGGHHGRRRPAHGRGLQGRVQEVRSIPGVLPPKTGGGSPQRTRGQRGGDRDWPAPPL